ncbi:MAG TPA: hypothetical protein VJ724_11915, partial [Tahibacter sp.]|nr:hypothetical protein [Tahibacter sp.]
SNQDLLSPTIDLGGFSPPVVVSWAHRYQMDTATNDHYNVSVRQAGAPATAVGLFEHLDAVMADSVGNPPTAVPASAGWGVVSRRADAMVGNNVELLFHLDSGTGATNFGGVAIDDVTVTACRVSIADLSITKTDGATTATPGGNTTYTIVASNAGPGSVTGATVADTFPSTLACTWTCVGAGGGACTAAGSGNISDSSVNLPAGGSATYTATCAIDAGATGTLSNTATVSSPIADPDPANNSATDTDTLTPQADLSITKTDGVAAVTAGGTTTYTIVASNAGPSHNGGATVIDTFPAALTCTWTCVGAGGGTCTASGSGNIGDTVNLPAGGSTTYTASCAIALTATGPLGNSASVLPNGVAMDPDPSNNTATDTDTVNAAGANVTATKTVTGNFVPGASGTYTIVLTNTGGAQADNSGDEFTDTLPAGLVVSSATATSGTATNTPTTVSWNGAIPIGGSVTITIGFGIAPTATGTLVNQGTVSYDSDANGTNDATRQTDDPSVGGASDGTAFTLGGPQADLAITKTDGVATATPGGTTTYTIVASNAGPSSITGASVADTFPAALTCTWTCAGSSGGTCTASGSGNIADSAALPVGASATYTAACTVSGSATGTLANTATVASAVTDPNPANNSATDTDTILVPAAVSGTKTVSGTFSSGGTVTYTVTLSNTGGAQADNPGNEFTDVLPAQLTLVSATATSGTASTAGNTATWNGTIPSGGSVTITITATINAGASGSVSNQGTISYDSNGDGTNDATATTDDPGTGAANDPTTFGITPTADLSITKTDGVTSVTAGGSTTYTIVATNTGPNSITGATVADTFPASLTCTWTCAGSDGGTCTGSGSGNIADTVNLPFGAAVTYTAVCAINGSATGTLSNTATVAVPAGAIDPTPGNNSATDTDTIVVPAAVTGTKTVSGTFLPNGTVTYTIVLNNAGGAAQGDNPGNEFSDVLPASLTLVSANATSGTAVASVATNTVTWNGPIPAGGSVTITITATVNASATGTISNQGTIAHDADNNGTNESNGVTDDPSTGVASDPTSFALGAAADLVVTKTDGLTAVVAGTSSTYTITVGNLGPSAITGASVTDTFPAECTAPTWTCAATGGGTCPASGSGAIAATVDLPVSAMATFTA